MAHGLSSVFETGTNELSRDEYIAMLADGTGLSEEAAANARTEWSALTSLVDPIFTLPGAGHPAFTALKGQVGTLEADVDNLKSQRIRIDEPGGGDQEMDADELDADAFLEDEEGLCWKHLTVTGCADASCPSIHMDRQGMGWCPSERQTDLLRSRVRSLQDKEWDFGKIAGFELDAGIFN